MKKLLFLILLMCVVWTGCAKQGSVHCEPAWNRPPSERYQSPSGETSKDENFSSEYQKLTDQKKKPDPYFEEFLKRQNKKVKK